MIAAQACRTAPYTRRRPEQSTLYRLVQEHLETYLLLAGEGEWGAPSVPAQVEREFRRYLECGILAPRVARPFRISRKSRRNSQSTLIFRNQFPIF